MSPINRREALKRGTGGILAAALFGRALAAEASPDVNEAPAVAWKFDAILAAAWIEPDMGHPDLVNREMTVTAYADGTGEISLRRIPSARYGDPDPPLLVKVPLDRAAVAGLFEGVVKLRPDRAA